VTGRYGRNAVLAERKLSPICELATGPSADIMPICRMPLKISIYARSAEREKRLKMSNKLLISATMSNKGILMPVIEAVKSGTIDPRRLVLINGDPWMLDIRFRMISNPELAKAMSFTTAEYEYEFTGTGEDVTRQIGNAVPCETAKALVKVILQ
jgi:site-specific DNA-cytosine methylase